MTIPRPPCRPLPRTRFYPALAWFYHTEYRGERSAWRALLQPVNEGGIIGMAEIYVAEVASRRYLAGQLLFSSRSTGAAADPGAGWAGYYAGSCAPRASTLRH